VRFRGTRVMCTSRGRRRRHCRLAGSALRQRGRPARRARCRGGRTLCPELLGADLTRLLDSAQEPPLQQAQLLRVPWPAQDRYPQRAQQLLRQLVAPRSPSR